MAEGKELKLTSEGFESAISSLTGYKDTLNSERDALSATNDEMKSDWLGDGGTAFALSAKVIEEEFKERINELEGEINDLNNAKATMFGLDYYIANAIKGAIEGTVEKVETVEKVYENVINNK